MADIDEDLSGDALLERLWARVLEAWDDDKPHAALLEYALRTERLPDVAGRYRALKDDPAKGERAQKKLNGIVVAATQLLFAMKTPAAPKKGPWAMTLLAAIVCLAMLAWLTYAILLKPQ